MSKPEKLSLPCSVAFVRADMLSNVRGTPDSVLVSCAGFSEQDYSTRSDASDARAVKRAKAKLAASLVKRLKEAKAHDDDSGSTIIGCTDGTVLVCRRGGYDICGTGREHSSLTLFACGLKDCASAARKHAADSYGGIAWETRGYA